MSSKLERMAISGGVSLIGLVVLQFFISSWTAYAVFGAFAVLMVTLVRFREVKAIAETLGLTIVLTVVLALAGGESLANRLLVGRSADMLGGLSAARFAERLVPATMVATSLILAVFVVATIVMIIIDAVKKYRAHRAL